MNSTGLSCMMQVLAESEAQIGRKNVIIGGGSDRFLARGELGKIQNIHFDGRGRLVLRCTHGDLYLALAPHAAVALQALKELPVRLPDGQGLEMEVTEFRDEADGMGSAGNGVRILGSGRH